MDPVPSPAVSISDYSDTASLFYYVGELRGYVHNLCFGVIEDPDLGETV